MTHERFRATTGRARSWRARDTDQNVGADRWSSRLLRYQQITFFPQIPSYPLETWRTIPSRRPPRKTWVFKTTCRTVEVRGCLQVGAIRRKRQKGHVSADRAPAPSKVLSGKRESIPSLPKPVEREDERSKPFFTLVVTS